MEYKKPDPVLTPEQKLRRLVEQGAPMQYPEILAVCDEAAALREQLQEARDTIPEWFIKRGAALLDDKEAENRRLRHDLSELASNIINMDLCGYKMVFDLARKRLAEIAAEGERK